MKHKHRILPGHMGGNYEEGNIVELSITQHAMYHFANWQLWGKVEDFIAWKGLSGQYSKKQIVQELLSEAGKKGGRATQNARTLEQKQKTCSHMRKSLTKEILANGGRNGPPGKHSRAGILSGLKRQLSVKLTSPVGIVYCTESVKIAAEIAQCKPGSLVNVLKGRRRQVKGWVAEYL